MKTILELAEKRWTLKPITYLHYAQLEQYEKYITEQFSSLPYFVKASILDEDTLSKYEKEIGHNVPSDFADSQKNQVLRLFYVRTLDGKIELYNFLNTRIGEVMEYGRDINCGVRMILVMIEQKKKEIADLKKKAKTA